MIDLLLDVTFLSGTDFKELEIPCGL